MPSELPSDLLERDLAVFNELFSAAESVVGQAGLRCTVPAKHTLAKDRLRGAVIAARKVLKRVEAELGLTKGEK